jgi:hypothetical protein
MFLWGQRSGILGTHSRSRRGKSGPQKDTLYAGLAMTHDLKAPKGFPWSHRILQEICP